MHPNPTFTYSPDEKIHIWDNLISLAKNKQALVVTQVIDELNRHYTADISWLSNFDCIICRAGHDPALDTLVGEIQRLHRTLVNVHVSHIFEPADPWLIAVAKKYGYTLVTSELGLFEGRTTDLSKEHIPDVCNDPVINVSCIHFPQLVIDENLLT